MTTVSYMAVHTNREWRNDHSRLCFPKYRRLVLILETTWRKVGFCGCDGHAVSGRERAGMGSCVCYLPPPCLPRPAPLRGPGVKTPPGQKKPELIRMIPARGPRTPWSKPPKTVPRLLKPILEPPPTARQPLRILAGLQPSINSSVWLVSKVFKSKYYQ
jgi:hypothetical protein